MIADEVRLSCVCARLLAINLLWRSYTLHKVPLLKPSITVASTGMYPMNARENYGNKVTALIHVLRVLHEDAYILAFHNRPARLLCAATRPNLTPQTRYSLIHSPPLNQLRLMPRQAGRNVKSPDLVITASQRDKCNASLGSAFFPAWPGDPGYHRMLLHTRRVLPEVTESTIC